jgi:hypothetical protein
MVSESRRFGVGALFLVALAGLTAGAMIARVVQPRLADDGGYVRLSDGVGGCSVQESGGILEKSSFVYMGKGQNKVRWRVFNDCTSGGTVRVTVTNFQEAPGAAKCEAADTVLEGERSVAVAPGHRDKIELKLKDAPKQIYYYAVCVDGAPVSDPILRIER